MEKELPSSLSRPNGFDESNDLSEYIAKAIKMTKERIEDADLAGRVTHLFESIRLLCSLNRDKINQLTLLTNQLLMGVTESGYDKNWDLLRREIEYVRAELKPFIDLTVN